MRALGSFVLTVATALLPVLAQAHDYAVDQANTGEPGGSWSVGGLAPLGQEFVPGRALMDVASFTLSNFTGPAQPAQVLVRVREGSITGPVLGVSETVTLPYPSSDAVHFDFPTPVAVTPGASHVLELVLVPGGGDVMASGLDFNPYPGGRMLYEGNPVEALDLWFFTGLTRELPAQRHSWGGLKELWQ